MRFEGENICSGNREKEVTVYVRSWREDMQVDLGPLVLTHRSAGGIRECTDIGLMG